MKKIMHIIILYGNENEVLNHLKDLQKQTIAQNIQVVIVINKINNEEQYKKFLQDIDLLYIKIKIYNPNKNLGYLNGCIYGYEMYSEEEKEKFEWYIISNTDIEFENNQFYERLINKNYENNIWCIAPSVYNSKNLSYDNPEYKERVSLNKINLLIFIYSYPFLAKVHESLCKIKGNKIRNKKEESQYIYSAKGCFFILKQEIIKILSERKYGVLMYSEESYIAELIKEKEKKIYYESSIEVIHNESMVTDKLGIIKKSKYISESLKLIKRNFYTKK